MLADAAGPYDDPKTWALPILVAATGVAWLVRAGTEGRPGASAPDGGARLIRGLVLGCLGWWVITTMTSLAPLQSLVGSFGRGMGLLTMGSGALLFFLVRSECRTPRATRRLVDLALLGSVPVCVLALGQAAGWDPLPRVWDPVLRSMPVRSTFGSHVFLGSYLVVLIPLTAARLEWALRAPRGRWSGARVRGRRGLTAGLWVGGAVALIGFASRWSPAWWALVPWGILGATVCTRRDDEADMAGTASTPWFLAGLLAAQVLVVVLSRGRGAFIGMLVGLAVTSLALLARRRAWKALAIAGLGLLGVLGFVTLLNVSGSPVRSLATVPLWSRLADISNVRHGSPGWVRLQVWKGIAEGWGRQLHGEEVFPGQSGWLRSIIGFGPETQLLALEPMTSALLGPLPTRTEGVRARYVVDRAHNVLLDHLVTEGLAGLLLWVLLLGSLLALGFARMRAGGGPGELTMRLGALGAMLAHLADGQVGIETTTTLTLFWFAAALLTSPPWEGGATATGASLLPRPSRLAALALVIVLAVSAATTSTRWLLASVSYADGTRLAAAGQMGEGYRELRRSVALAPGLPLPAEAAAYAALRSAGSVTERARRLELLHEAESALAAARRHAAGGADSWVLAGQVAFALAQAGESGQLATSRDAFAAALSRRPGDPKLLAQLGWTWLESGQPERAREAAERALARDRREWLAWAVLARSAKVLGDREGADRAFSQARALVPPESQNLLEAWR